MKYSLQKIPAWLPTDENRRRLVLDGDLTDIIIPGDDIGGVFKLGSFDLLVTHYDYFDGVSHWFHLIKDGKVLLDSVSSKDYFGFMQDVVQDEPSRLRFGFYGTNDQWTLQLLPEAAYSFRASLRLFGKRFLKLTCQKGPPWKSPSPAV